MRDKRIYLAPMVGRTDEFYRSFVRIISPNISLFTEMVTCDAFLNTNRKNYKVNPEEGNLIIQLAGSEASKFSECAKIIEGQGYSEINLNIGCPSTKVIKGRFGACLMEHPNDVAEFVYQIKKSCSLPVSIKTRLGLGYGEDLKLLKKLISTTTDAGCLKYFIHARNAILNGISPKKNRKIPALRYDDALQIKEMFPDLIFILNGGLESIKDLKSNLSLFDGLMIGRKIYSEPLFLFDIESEVFGSLFAKSRLEILNEYNVYATRHSKDGVKNYLLLRHLYNLYYNTHSSKKWKKYLHEIIALNKNISDIIKFEEIQYEENIQTYG